MTSAALAENLPRGIAVDSAGNVYIADEGNYRIRKIAPNGTTTTLAGNGNSGWADGSGGPSGTTQFAAPRGVAVDANGNVYVSDHVNQRIRKVAPDGSTTTLAGNGVAGFADGTGGPTGTAQFNIPYGIAVDARGWVFVADQANNRIRAIQPDGTTTTLAGNGGSGHVDGTGSGSGTTQFATPNGVAIDISMVIYVTESGQYVRAVAPDGQTTTVAGDGSSRFADGPGCQAKLSTPVGVAVRGHDLIVGDRDNARVRHLVLP